MDDTDPGQNEAMIAAQGRMVAPIVWETRPDYEIQSLKDTRYDEAVNLIKHHYMNHDPMCASIDMSQDRDSVKRFLEMALTWMKDTLSICAVSVRTGRLVGVTVMRINSLIDKSEVYNRIQVLKGEALPMIMHLRSTLIRQADIYEVLNIGDYLKIYILSVHPSYEHTEVRSGLVEAAIRVCRSLGSPGIFGIFTSKADQDIARNLNLKIFSEIQYSRWIINDEVMFDDPGIGNYSAALMGTLVLEEEPEEIMKNRESVVEKGRNKKTGKSHCPE